MRKTWLTLLLLCLLVLAQEGSLAHEIGHLDGPVTAEQASSHGNPSADSVCVLCLAFAGLSVLAKPAVPGVPLLAVVHARPVVVACVQEGRRPARGRNRDPPAEA